MADINVIPFDTRSSLDAAAAAFIEAALASAIQDRGGASLMLSGGSSPKPVYEALGNAELNWDGVGISLVDERWVASGEVGSNADFIQACFKNRAAERAQFIPLHNGHAASSNGLEAVEQAMALLQQPFDVCVMGMGLDGHTASWFPNSVGLDAALDPKNPATVASIDASGCHVAGDHLDRITLTYSAIAKARHVVLLLPNMEKFDIFRAARDANVHDVPVRALYDFGDRLTVFALESGA